MAPMKNLMLICTSSLIFLSSCELADFGDSFQNDPNLLTPNQANPNYLLNNVQKETADLLQDLHEQTKKIMRYNALDDSYSDEANQAALNVEYTNFYAFLQDASIIHELALTDEDLTFHRGMSSILTAIATVAMVDILSNIPFSEANRGDEGIVNPKADDALEIYQLVLEQLDEAIEDLNNSSNTPINDLFYGGDAQKWIRLAQSFQLKMLIHLGDSDQIRLHIETSEFISSAEDFQFQYGTSASEPNSRHPDFNEAYTPGGYSEFLGNSFLNLLLNDKSARVQIPDYDIMFIDKMAQILQTTFWVVWGHPIFSFATWGKPTTEGIMVIFVLKELTKCLGLSLVFILLGVLLMKIIPAAPILR